jgi:hypothetical protein
MKQFALVTFAFGVGLLFLHACQDTPDITQPSTVTASITYRLTVSGLGTGNGVVTSSPAGINDNRLQRLLQPGSKRHAHGQAGEWSLLRCLGDV